MDRSMSSKLFDIRHVMHPESGSHHCRPNCLIACDTCKPKKTLIKFLKNEEYSLVMQEI